MRNDILFKVLLFTVSTFFFSMSYYGQCVECAPELPCGAGGDFPAFCPDEAEEATTGEYYEQILTFYLPAQIVDPGSNVQATLLSVTITSVSGLPYGLTYSLNDEDGVYHPSQGQNYGCATICGIPLLPGVYDVSIAVTADVTAFGMTMTQNENFPTVIVVNPGEGSTGSFSYDTPAGCGEIEVNFEATILAPAPSITTYEWDFGNGETSTAANPPTVTYVGEGEYHVVLTTTVSDYRLKAVHLENVTSSGWMGDEDILNQSPDPYFILYNSVGTAVYTSSSASDTFNYSWTELNILLDNPPYTIQFFDEDVLTSDDNLGSSSVNISNGDVAFNSGNGTLGTLVISLDTTTQISDEATILVFPVPDAEFTVEGNLLVCNNQFQSPYTWLRNGVVIPNANSSYYTMTEGGVYSCQVENEFNCFAESGEYLYCPPISIVYDEAAMEMEVLGTFNSYQWYFNGLPLSGQTNSFMSATQSGNYAVTVTTDYGCTTTSTVYTLVVGVENVIEIPVALVFPNPANGIATIQSEALRDAKTMTIHDSMGRIVDKRDVPFVNTMQVDMSTLATGVYTIRFGNYSCRIIKE